MEHKTLAVQENTNPLCLSVDHRVCHLDILHMSLVAPISVVLVDREIVEVVCTFKVLDSGSHGVELCSTDPPGSFAF